jgi:hypothetical protein
MMKTFTLDEANELLPVLESLLKAALESKSRLEQAQKAMEAVVHQVNVSGGCLLNIAEWQARKSDMEETAQHLHDTLAEIDSIGVQVKDLEIGLLDFPCRMDDEIVLLCWKMGESGIGYWHTQDAGFKGRKPIDERIIRNKKPN